MSLLSVCKLFHCKTDNPICFLRNPESGYPSSEQCLTANMTYMELSTVPIYMDEFVGACFIPHTDTSMFPTVMEEVQNR